MRRLAGLMSVVLLYLLLVTPVLAEPASCCIPRVGALMRNDLAILGGYLSVRESVFRCMSTCEEKVGRALLTLLNSNPHCYTLTEDGRLFIDEQALTSGELDGNWSEADLAQCLILARHLQNSKVTLDSAGASIRAVWYEHQLIHASDYHDQHYYWDTAYSRHPLPVSVSTSVTWGTTISGGATVPLQTLLAWLKLEYRCTWTATATYGPYTPKGPNDPTCSFCPRGEEAAIGHWDRHFHSSATYWQWYCTDEDVKGEITRWFQGEYTASGFRFVFPEDRTYELQRRTCYCAECNAAAQ